MLFFVDLQLPVAEDVSEGVPGLGKADQSDASPWILLPLPPAPSYTLTIEFQFQPVHFLTRTRHTHLLNR
jgi:hypothetical protein